MDNKCTEIYILNVLSLKAEKLCNMFNTFDDIRAFQPRYERYHRRSQQIRLVLLFPGYIFIKTKKNQEQFDNFMQSLYGRDDGVIRQLRYEGVKALKKEEVQLLKHLLNEEGIVTMSYATIYSGRAHVYKGPLVGYDNLIVKIDKHQRIAWLNVQFMQRNIKAGLIIKG